jgi:hypothetical protein
LRPDPKTGAELAALLGKALSSAAKVAVN